MQGAVIYSRSEVQVIGWILRWHFHGNDVVQIQKWRIQKLLDNADGAQIFDCIPEIPERILTFGCRSMQAQVLTGRF